jgi:CheY-like chemotaxis protein
MYPGAIYAILSSSTFDSDLAPEDASGWLLAEMSMLLRAPWKLDPEQSQLVPLVHSTSQPGSMTALIVARSPRFRESLAVLIRAIPQIGHIEQVEDIFSVLSMDVGVQPDLMLCDFESVRASTADIVRRLKVRWPHMHCVVMVEDETARKQARISGADVVLTKGILAARLLEAVETLLSRS